MCIELIAQGSLEDFTDLTDRNILVDGGMGRTYAHCFTPHSCIHSYYTLANQFQTSYSPLVFPRPDWVQCALTNLDEMFECVNTNSFMRVVALGVLYIIALNHSDPHILRKSR